MLRQKRDRFGSSFPTAHRPIAFRPVLMPPLTVTPCGNLPLTVKSTTTFGTVSNLDSNARVNDTFTASVQIVDALGSSRPTRKRVAVLAGLRYALLGGGSYVILRYSPVNLTAAMVGLFVAMAAVIVEICFELVYARND